MVQLLPYLEVRSQNHENLIEGMMTGNRIGETGIVSVMNVTESVIEIVIGIGSATEIMTGIESVTEIEIETEIVIGTVTEIVKGDVIVTDTMTVNVVIVVVTEIERGTENELYALIHENMNVNVSVNVTAETDDMIP